MTTAGLVSTIIAVYNRPALLVEAVNSARAQTYRPIEIVIVDDGSTDDTGEVAGRLARDSSGGIRYLRHDRNRFCGEAWNTGLGATTGEFVQFLDSDDLIYPHKFATQVAALQAHPECGISYGWIHEHPIDTPPSGLPARHTAKTFDTLFPQLLWSKIWPSPSPLYRRSILEANGPFLGVRVQPDWEFDARLGTQGVRLHHCESFLGETRGTHAREGRQKGGVPPGLEADQVLVLERIAAHATAAGVDPAALDTFSVRLFAAARLCATRSNIVEARRALTAATLLSTGSRRRLYRAYEAGSERLGWERAARLWKAVAEGAPIRSAVTASTLPVRAVRYAGRRSREAAHFVRGKNILRRYSSHYRRARRVYGVRPGASKFGAVGVMVARPGDRPPFAVPDDYLTRVRRVAASATAALAEASRCRFVPPLPAMPGAVQTAGLPEVRSGQVITAQLLEPFSIDGLHELCEPLLAEIERAVYGSYVLADKVYVYRSFASTASPRASWLWHFDNHPREMLKVMIYLTDVDASTAPFEYVRDRQGAPILGAPLTPMFGRSRVGQSDIDAIVAAGGSCEKVVGPPGTLIVFDDNVIHRGTVAQRGHRDVLVLQIRPSVFAASPRIDPRWTGSFRHWAINANPWELSPRLNPEHA